MPRMLALFALIASIAPIGCVGDVTTADTEVASFQFRTDQLGALLAERCVAQFGVNGCSRYPNPMECRTLRVSILGDGRTCGLCNLAGGKPRLFCGGVSDGIPVVCKASRDLQCQRCTDVYGNALVDNCDPDVVPFRAGGPGGGFPTPLPDDNSPPETGSAPGGAPAPKGCDAGMEYARRLNAIIQSEGLKMTYAPSQTGAVGGFLSGMFGGKLDMCKLYANNSLMTRCWSNQPGRCHCTGGPTGQKTCRCARMTTVALRDTCNAVPAGCDANRWAQDTVREFGASTVWLFAASYGNAGYYGGVPAMADGGNLPPGSGSLSPPGDAPPDTNTPPGSSTPPGTFAPPTCLGSPLVLDLAGDGVHPTSTAGGVTFDLLGHGPVRTSWIAGDDALLVLDRNGNGRIDDGTELFGPAVAPVDDGFAALALLDQPGQGGNNDGRIDAGDLMFGELRLWTDTDGDGRSRPFELRHLSSAGVVALSLAITRTSSPVTDRHGNDLGLRGSFQRAGGDDGLMVDVLFVTGR